MLLPVPASSLVIVKAVSLDPRLNWVSRIRVSMAILLGEFEYSDSHSIIVIDTGRSSLLLRVVVLSDLLLLLLLLLLHASAAEIASPLHTATVLSFQKRASTNGVASSRRAVKALLGANILPSSTT